MSPFAVTIREGQRSGTRVLIILAANAPAAEHLARQVMKLGEWIVRCRRTDFMA